MTAGELRLTAEKDVRPPVSSPPAEERVVFGLGRAVRVEKAVGRSGAEVAAANRYRREKRTRAADGIFAGGSRKKERRRSSSKCWEGRGS